MTYNRDTARGLPQGVTSQRLVRGQTGVILLIFTHNDTLANIN